MKKQCYRWLSIFLLAMICSRTANAQQSANISGSNLFENVSYESKADGPTRAGGHSYPINIKAVRDLLKSFKDAEQIKWYQISGGMMAYFINKGIKIRSSYDTKGNWLYNLRSYDETLLPKEVRKQVKTNYYDYTINWVNEITNVHQVIYFVHLQDKKSRIIVKLAGEEMEITDEFTEN